MMYLGIDMGTSSVKTVLMDETQTILASADAPLSVSRPRSGWSEQDPADWWEAVTKTIDALAASHPREIAAVEGIGLSGQMHGATLLDASDAVLRPAILWNDGRSAAECTELEAACPTLRDIAGNIAMPGFTAPKLAWVRKHEPEIFAKVARVLLPKDYVRLLLIGDAVSEMSDAAGTLWLDVGKRQWSKELLAATHLEERHMPRLVEGSQASGTLRSELCQRWGMVKVPVVAGGGGDNAASACGMGAVRPGSAFISLGTSGVLFATTDRFSPNTKGAVHAFCHAVPETWHQMGVILSATDSLQWLSRISGQNAAAMTGALGESVSGPSSVMFLPYLSGERTPHNDASARGVFVGLGQDSGLNDVTQAVMEGVAFAFRDCLRVLGDAGTVIESAMAVGGGAKSRLWLKILASVLNRPLTLPKDGSLGAAFGAARLGLVAASGADPFTVCAPLAIETQIDPDGTLAKQYEERYALYQSLYPAVRGALHPRS